LYLHGGQRHLNDRTGHQRVDRELAESGVLVVALDFRLAPEYAYPAAIQDVHYGVRWWKGKASEYRGDPDTLGLFGSSSGGHISELIAMRPHDPIYGALEFPTGSRDGGGHALRTDAHGAPAERRGAGPVSDATVAYLILRAPISDPYARYQFAERTGRKDILK